MSDDGPIVAFICFCGLCAAVVGGMSCYQMNKQEHVEKMKRLEMGCPQVTCACELKRTEK